MLSTAIVYEVHLPAALQLFQDCRAQQFLIQAATTV